MKIMIEARALSASMGVKTYVTQLIRHLVRRPTHQYSVVLSARTHRALFPPADELVLPLSSAVLLPWWLHYQFPRLLAAQRPAVVHFTKADVPHRKTCPTVATIYDVIPLLFPSSQPLLPRWYWPGALHRAAHYSDHIMTISEASKQDIVRYLQVPANKITVTPLAVDLAHFKPAGESAVTAIRNKYQLIGPYILFVGTWEPRKNIPTLLRAFATASHHLPHQLVLAGRKGWRYASTERTLAGSPVRSRVTVLDYADYQDLPALYSAAAVFVWPSVYEGWGLPVQEALACGTPVIVSDGGALPQVVGQAGTIVPFSTEYIPARVHDTTFEARLAQALAAYQGKTEQRQKQAITQARRFSWEQVAAQTTKVYERMGQL